MSGDNETTGWRPNLVLLAKRRAKGWGRGRAAGELRRLWLKNFPGTPAAESIVKTMRRHENGESQVRDEIYRRLYCMIYESTPQELFGAIETEPPAGGELAVRSHKFIPGYVGAAAAARLVELHGCEPDTGQWMPCHLRVGDEPGAATLYVWPFGVVVFHLPEDLVLPNIATLSVWRQRTYPENLRWATTRLRALTGEDVLAAYVFSNYLVKEPIWGGDTLHAAMRILSMPKVLTEDKEDVEVESAALVEQALLANCFDPPAAVSFGLAGISIGYASWSAVAYHPVAPSRALAEDDLVRCELATQSLWAYCAHLNNEIENGRDPQVPTEYSWRFLRAVRSRLINPRPQEDGQHRSMRMAIIETSEIMNHMAHLIDALRENDRV